MEALWTWETRLTIAMQSLGDWLLIPMKTISLIGQVEFYLFMTAAILWCLNRRVGQRLFILLWLSVFLNAFLKLAFHFPRPYWVDPQVLALSNEPSFGLPSGHAQFAATLLGFAGIKFKRRLGLAAAGVFLIGFSRIYLGVHFTSDVISGWLLGMLILFLFLRWENRVWAILEKMRLFQGLLFAAVIAAILLLVTNWLSSGMNTWVLPAQWVQNAQRAAPGAAIKPLAVDNLIVAAGAIFGSMLGFILFARFAHTFTPSGTTTQRWTRLIPGVAGMLVLYAIVKGISGLHLSLVTYATEFAGFALISMWVIFLAPLLFIRMKLVNQAEGKNSVLQSENDPI